jgi:hypothetical protein
MTLPLVSVIILTFNGKDYIQDCLSSVLAQTHVNIEVIVVDNASVDETAEFVVEQFPLLKVIRNSSNLGHAGGNNIGIQIANGTYVVLLNQDTRVDPHWIENLVKAADVDERIGMCASKILYMDDSSRLNSIGLLFYKDLSVVSHAIGCLDNGQYDKHGEAFGPHGAAAFYRKKMIDDIGDLDEDYFMGGDDSEIAWRARLAGWKCVYVPSAIVYHARSTRLGLYSPFKLYNVEKTRVWTVVKFLPFSLVISSLFYTLRRYGATVIFVLRSTGVKAQSTRGQSITKLGFALIRSWLGAFWGLPKMIKKRRIIWKTRKASNQEIRSWLKQYEATLNDVINK